MTPPLPEGSPPANRIEDAKEVGLRGTPVLFTDTAKLVGAHLVGVTDAGGVLLASRRIPVTRTNLAEMHGVLLATEYATASCGVILTDSLDTVRWLGAYGTKHPDSKQLAALLEIREAVAKAWPVGWTLAWVPDRANLAHKALQPVVRVTR